LVTKILKTAVALLLMTGASEAATVTASVAVPVFLATAAQVSTHVRNGQNGLAGAAEIFVAPDGNANDGGTSAQGQFAWTVNLATAFSFAYSATGGFNGQGLLTTTLGASSAVFGDVVGEAIAGGLTFNALQFAIQGPNASAETAFTLSNLVISGTTVGPASFSVGNATADFGVTGFGTLSNFLISGTLTRTGTSLINPQARPHLDLVMGSVAVAPPPAPVPVPAALPLMLVGLGSLAALMRRRRS
jgi:hypothetical protein